MDRMTSNRVSAKPRVNFNLRSSNLVGEVIPRKQEGLSTADVTRRVTPASERRSVAETEGLSAADVARRVALGIIDFVVFA